MPINRLPPEDDFESFGPKYYVLDDRGRPVRAASMMEFAIWFETAERVVKKDRLGDIEVSTVFLGMDHSHFPGEAPILWETMIFGGEHDQYQYRYSSREEALLGHERAVQLVQQAQQMKEQGETVSQWLARHHPSFN